MNFTLNEQELVTLGKALSMLPYGEVAGIINKLNTQINEQKEDKSEVHSS